MSNSEATAARSGPQTVDQLTGTLRYRWECSGNLVLPGVLSPDEARAVNATIDRHFAEFQEEYRERSPGSFQHVPRGFGHAAMPNDSGRQRRTVRN